MRCRAGQGRTRKGVEFRAVSTSEGCCTGGADEQVSRERECEVGGGSELHQRRLLLLTTTSSCKLQRHAAIPTQPRRPSRPAYLRESGRSSSIGEKASARRRSREERQRAASRVRANDSIAP